MTRVLKYSVADTSPSLLFVMKGNDEQAIPLSDNGNEASVYAKIRKSGLSTNTNDNNNLCTIVDANNGMARYDFVNTDLPSTGTYELQLQVVLPSGREFSNKENIIIQVKEKF